MEGNSVKESVTSFFSHLKDFFSSYEKKKIYPEFLENFIDCEDLLNQVLPKHAIHYDHVIQVFLLGFNILTHWDYILEKQANCDDNQNFFCFRNLIFSWITASLFHDYGYILEQIHEHFQNLNDKLKSFSEIFDIPYFEISPIRYNLEKKDIKEYLYYIHEIYENLPNITELNSEEFQNLFLITKNEIIL